MTLEHETFLIQARQVAENLIRHRKHPVGIDQIRSEIVKRGITIPTPMLLGNVVRDKRFKWAGKRRSTTLGVHGREINLWTLAHK